MVSDVRGGAGPAGLAAGRHRAAADGRLRRVRVVQGGGGGRVRDLLVGLLRGRRPPLPGAQFNRHLEF